MTDGIMEACGRYRGIRHKACYEQRVSMYWHMERIKCQKYVWRRRCMYLLWSTQMSSRLIAPLQFEIPTCILVIDWNIMATLYLRFLLYFSLYTKVL